MRSQLKKAAVASALALLGTGGAHATVIAPSAAGGSEAVLTVINNADKSNVSLDLGGQIASLFAGETFNLPNQITAFISAAGGLGSVNFSLMAASTGTRTYLTSTADAGLGTLSNTVVNGSWNSAITNYTSALNSGDASATSVNNSYGTYFNPGPDSGNVYGFGYNVWNASTQNDGSALLDLNLFQVVAGASAFGNAAITSPWAGAQARLTVDQLQLLPAVPVPAAAWLFGSALGLLGLGRRKQS